LKAQRIHCLSNVKQLALGSFMYASEIHRHARVETSSNPRKESFTTAALENDHAIFLASISLISGVRLAARVL